MIDIIAILIYFSVVSLTADHLGFTHSPVPLHAEIIGAHELATFLGFGWLYNAIDIVKNIFSPFIQLITFQAGNNAFQATFGAFLIWPFALGMLYKLLRLKQGGG